MKRLCLLISFIVACSFAKAQQTAPVKQGQDIEALKIAFISNDLHLTPQEAERFWPLYNQYSHEIKAVYSEKFPSVITRDEHILNIKKHYNDQFAKIIGADRTNTLFSSEARFREILIKKAMRRQERMGQNHPTQRLFP